MDQFRKFGKYTVFVAPVLMCLIYGDRQSMPENSDGFCSLDISKLFLIPKESQAAYNRLVVDIIDDLIQLGYI